MGNTDDAFKMLAGKAVTEAINSTNKKNNSAMVRSAIAMTGILFLVGHEGIKIVFRKNFGMGIMGLIRTIILCLALLVLAGVSIYFSIHKDTEILLYRLSPLSFIVTGVLYVSLAACILIRGIKQYRVSKELNLDPEYDGESNLLSFLNSNYGWKESTIKYFAEPFYVLCLGAIYFFYNPIGSIPFAACALSVWGYPVVKLFFPANLQANLQNNRPQAPQINFAQSENN